MDHLTDIFGILNEAGYAGHPYHQRAAYVETLIEYWSTVHVRWTTRVVALVVYVVCLGAALFMGASVM